MCFFMGNGKEKSLSDSPAQKSALGVWPWLEQTKGECQSDRGSAHILFLLSVAQE